MLIFLVTQEWLRLESVNFSAHVSLNCFVNMFSNLSLHSMSVLRSLFVYCFAITECLYRTKTVFILIALSLQGNILLLDSITTLNVSYVDAIFPCPIWRNALSFWHVPGITAPYAVYMKRYKRRYGRNAPP